MITNSHPTLPEFDYVRPETLAEASEFLALHPHEAHPFLGGTDIFVRMWDGFLSLKFLVDVKNLDVTNNLRFDPEAGLTIWAAVSMNRVIASPEVQTNYPLLVEACRSVASYQLRMRATLAGAISRGDRSDHLLEAVEEAMQVGHASGMEAATGLLLGLSVWDGYLV